MKKSRLSMHTVINVMLHALTVTFAGCGVEAGNPDSKGDKLLRVYVAPASFPDTRAISASIQQVRLINGSSFESKEYQSQLFEIIASNSTGSQDSTLGFTVERDEVSSIEKVEMILTDNTPYLQINLESQVEPAFAAVIDENGQLKKSLIFSTKSNLINATDIIIDVELRKSLSVVTETQREQLQLPAQVQFVILQKHSFVSTAEVGSITFTNFAPSSLVCVFSGETLPTANSNACIGSEFKSQIVAADGKATIGSLAPGNYRVVNITSDNKVIELDRTSVSAGEKSLVKKE